ncbi:condensation domain-containing protein [Propioniciclava flava]
MSTTAETEAGRASNVVGVTRLTPAQEGMLYHMLAEPDLQLHVTTIQFDLVGDIDLGLLHDAFSRVVEDVPTLRTTFHWADLPHPVQVTHTRLDYPFLVTSAPDDEPLPVLDLAGGPVHGIVATPVDDHVRVRWRHFDLLFDGWSLALLLDRLMTTYTQLAGGQPHAANPSPTVNAAVEAMHRPAPAADLEFWESRLGAIDVRPLPALGAVAHRGDFCDVATSLDKQATSRLSAFAAELGVSFNTVLQGVWSIVLSRMTGQGRAMFGQVTSGRDLDVPQMDDLVGVFVNTVPIVVEVTQRPHSAVGSKTYKRGRRRRFGTNCPSRSSWHTYVRRVESCRSIPS